MFQICSHTFWGQRVDKLKKFLLRVKSIFEWILSKCICQYVYRSNWTSVPGVNFTYPLRFVKFRLKLILATYSWLQWSNPMTISISMLSWKILAKLIHSTYHVTLVHINFYFHINSFFCFLHLTLFLVADRSEELKYCVGNWIANTIK